MINYNKIYKVNIMKIVNHINNNKAIKKKISFLFKILILKDTLTNKIKSLNSNNNNKIFQTKKGL